MPKTSQSQKSAKTHRRSKFLLVGGLTLGVVLGSSILALVLTQAAYKTIRVDFIGGSFDDYCLISAKVDSTLYCVEGSGVIKDALGQADKEAANGSAPVTIEAKVRFHTGEKGYTFKSSVSGEDTSRTRTIPTIFIDSAGSARLVE